VDLRRKNMTRVSRRNNNKVDDTEFLSSINILSAKIQNTKTILDDKKLLKMYEESKEKVDNKRKFVGFNG
jgi:hypothetical protein